MPLQFETPWILYLLWLAPLAGLLMHGWVSRRPAAAGFLSSVMAARLAPAPAPGRRTWQIVLVSAAILLALLALARPQWGSREETVYQRGRDVMLVLDVSRSMLATDVHPSRLGRAKVDLMDLVRQLRGDRVGLLAFRGRPVLLCPLTVDYGFLSQALEGVDIDSAPMGETDIGDALVKAMESFEGDEGSHRAIVLISDGDDLSGHVDKAIEQARQKGVTIFTVGLGSTEGARIPATASGKPNYLTYRGSEVTSKLNHQVMQMIAEKTGGAYVPVGVANVKLGDLYRDHLSRVAAREQEESIQRRAVERFQLFLLPAVLCLLAAAFLSRGQTWLGRPHKPTPPSAKRQSSAGAGTMPPPIPTTPPPLAARTALWAVLLAGTALSVRAAGNAATNAPEDAPAAPAPVAAATNVPPGRAGALKAQALYVAGRYEEAAAAYLGAARGSIRKPRFDYLYNAGCALLKAGRYAEAADTFRGLLAMEDADLGTASYNLGCALNESAAVQENTPHGQQGPPDAAAAETRVDTLAQAVTAFQRASRVAPDDADSHRNLAVVAAKSLQAQADARIAKAMAAHGQTPPDTLADQMLLQQRQLVAEIPEAFTNTTPALIPALESLAARQDETADMMIALKGKLLEAVARQPQAAASNAPSPQQMAAQINGFAESIRDSMEASSDALRDLNDGALSKAARSETATYHLWKGIAGYALLLREDLLRQSNAISATAPHVADATPEQRAAIAYDQDEALDLTQLFSTRFEQSVPPEGLSVPVSPATNAPAGSTNTTKQILSPENRAKILELAGQAVQTQQAALSAVTNALSLSLGHQRRSYDLLKEIEKLLPKQEPPPQSQQQKQEQQKNDQEQKDKQPQQSQQKPQPQPQDSKPEPKPEQQKTPESMARDDVQKMLDKAVQREKEHEYEKRQRDAYSPLSPVERDW